MARDPPLRIAVVGAGPAGLAATIHFRRLPNIQLSVYDGTKELKEVGAVRRSFTPSLLYLDSSPLYAARELETDSIGYRAEREHLETFTALRSRRAH